jgi:hypothetical protein
MQLETIVKIYRCYHAGVPKMKGGTNTMPTFGPDQLVHYKNAVLCKFTLNLMLINKPLGS